MLFLALFGIIIANLTQKSKFSAKCPHLRPILNTLARTWRKTPFDQNEIFLSAVAKD